MIMNQHVSEEYESAKKTGQKMANESHQRIYIIHQKDNGGFHFVSHDHFHNGRTHTLERNQEIWRLINPTHPKPEATHAP